MLWFVSACSGARFARQGQHLYIGALSVVCVAGVRLCYGFFRRVPGLVLRGRGSLFTVSSASIWRSDMQRGPPDITELDQL